MLRRFLASPGFMNYLAEHSEASIYGSVGISIPIILALLLNQIQQARDQEKIQLLIYAPNFISVIVLCTGMVRMFLFTCESAE